MEKWKFDITVRLNCRQFSYGYKYVDHKIKYILIHYILLCIISC